jgi:fumarate hydratase, class II
MDEGMTRATPDDARYRIEHDTMGDVRLPAEARWGAQTQRAVENFPVSGVTMDRSIVAALASIKGAAASVNAVLGVLDPDVAEAIQEAARAVADGRWDTEFPVDVFQTGSGTSTNMNANEVIASLASERLGRRVHPNDHVNASQSSNDVFPSAVHLAATMAIVRDLVPALRHLAGTIRKRADAFSDVVKAGRTHLMDAVPVTLGQVLGGHATAVERGIERLEDCLVRLGELPLGGTAVGTGLNCPPGFAGAVVERLRAELAVPVTEARDHFEAQGARDSLVEASGMCRVVAVSLTKIADDLRWMASGPTAGLAEIRLPDLQPGSSIMPGKVNPVIPEVVLQVAAQVVGNDATVAWAGGRGSFELNVMVPVMGRNLLESIRLLAAAAVLLADRCVAGMEADRERCRAYALSSPALATVLNPAIGYEAAARVVKRAVAERRTIRDVVLEERLLGEEDADRVLDVLAMTEGGVRA